MLRALLSLFALAVLVAQAPLPKPSQPSTNQQTTAANSAQNKQSAASPRRKIQSTNPKTGSGAKKDDQHQKSASWTDWFKKNDHWIVIGTLILAGASIFQIEIARRTAKRQLRAYVLIDNGGVYDASRIGLQESQPNVVLLTNFTNFIAVDLVIKNSGQTPAGHVVHWAQLAISDVANEYLLVPPENLEESQASVIGPGQVNTKSLLFLPFPLAPPVIAQIVSHDKGIYVYGKIVYRDIFKRRRTTTYRLRYSGVWPPIPSGNFQYSLTGNDFT